jgi:hypothetical protein
MLLGGGIHPNKAFKKILSIGYEFETNGISKLSLHSNKKSLINSDLTLRTLEEKLERGSAKLVDDNYISVGIAIGVDLTKLEPDEKEEPIVLTEEEEEDREHWEEVYRLERLEKKYSKIENEKYLDYFYENRKTDNKKVVKFQVTNDLGESDFETMIKNMCSGLTIPKNDMFVFKTNAGKIYDIKFAEGISSNDVCETFSGVEYVITYFSPKRENANIILDTFVDACSRIVDHLADVKKITGTLMISNDEKKDFTTVGNILDKRCLYHKPNTNLFYMDIYDDEETMKLQNLRDIYFIPQMTFKTKAYDTLDVMKEILDYDEEYTVSNDLISSMESEYNDLVFIEDIVDELIQNYNQIAKKPIDVSAQIGKTIKLYMFLLFYKMYQFNFNHARIYKKTNYLKDYLTFSSRHSNFILYSRIKEILEDEFGVTDVSEVKALFFDSVILEKIFEGMEETEDDFDENDNYKYDYDAYVSELPESDPNFGNPLFSISSYFDHMEVKKGDWFRSAGFDVFSSVFPLSGDEVLIENRYFAAEIILYLKNTIDPRISHNEISVNKVITLKDMDNIVNKLYGDKVKNMINLERNPTKKKLTLKCRSGYYLNLDFECVPNKKTKNDRRLSKMKKTRKSSLPK